MWLIKFEANWADEFNCQQFEIVDSEEKAEAYVKELLNYDPDVDDGYIGFGTNQGWEEGEITERHFTITELETYQHEALEALFGQTFGNIKFGTGPL